MNGLQRGTDRLSINVTGRNEQNIPEENFPSEERIRIKTFRWQNGPHMSKTDRT